MLDTYAGLWKQVLLRCPMAGPMLAQSWVQYSFRKIVETKRWSWLVKQGQLVCNNVISTGTVQVSTGDQTVTGTGTAWDTSIIGRQFRVSINYPIYTIAGVDAGAQTLTLDQPWGAGPVTGVNYLVYNAYFVMPTDFHSVISIWDPSFNWQLNPRVLQSELNAIDSQRANSGTAYVLSFRDYDPLAAAPTVPLPRYELWPHQFSAKPYPYLYETRPPDLNDQGATLPRYIRGDVVLEGALWQATLWPGPSSEKPNPYFSVALANQHRTNFQQAVMELERQDSEIDPIDVLYSSVAQMPFAAVPFLDAHWQQSHA